MGRGIWGICPVCNKERQIKAGIIIIHRRYSVGEMIHCEGSRSFPAEITRKAKNEKETA